MSKPFTAIAAVVFLAVAAAHAYRIYANLGVTLGHHDVPMSVSWAGGVIAALLAVMLLVERRGGGDLRG
jgi:hypothetical protein